MVQILGRKKNKKHLALKKQDCKSWKNEAKSRFRYIGEYFQILISIYQPSTMMIEILGGERKKKNLPYKKKHYKTLKNEGNFSFASTKSIQNRKLLALIQQTSSASVAPDSWLTHNNSVEPRWKIWKTEGMKKKRKENFLSISCITRTKNQHSQWSSSPKKKRRESSTDGNENPNANILQPRDFDQKKPKRKEQENGPGRCGDRGQ